VRTIDGASSISIFRIKEKKITIICKRIHYIMMNFALVVQRGICADDVIEIGSP